MRLLGEDGGIVGSVPGPAGHTARWVVVSEGPPRLWRQYIDETETFIGPEVDILPDVDAAVASSVEAQVPALVSEAVESDIAGRDLVQRSDPGIPQSAETTTVSYKQTWQGPNGELLRGDRSDGTVEIPYGRLATADVVRLLIGGGTTQWLEAAGLSWVPFTDPDGRIPEIHLDSNLRLSEWACQRIVARGSGGVSASAPIDIIILAGQSNATQRSSLTDVIEPPVDDVLQWDGTSFTQASGVPWLGSGFARRYQEMHGRPEKRRTALVPAALGSSGFSTVVSPGTWDRTVTTGADRYLYPEMIAKAQAALAAAPVGSRIRCVIWSQGEADRSIASTTYASKLDDLIEQTRIDLGISDLPFLISSLNPDWLTYLASVSDSRGATLDAVLEDTPRRVARTSFTRGVAGLPEAAVSSNGIHWQPLGQKLRGIAMAEAGLDAALLNVATSEAQPPQNIRISRSGGVATVLWDHPQSRVTAYTLDTSVDSGSNWVTQTLSAVTTHKHVMSVPAGTPLWVRLSATNETGSSFLQEVHG